LAPWHLHTCGQITDISIYLLFKGETYLNATRFLFTKRQQGNILNVWSIGDTFKAIHVSTSDE